MRRRPLLGAALAVLAVAALAAAWVAWRGAEHLPVAEARRFLHAPIAVGEEPPPATGPAASPEETRTRYASAETAFQEGRYEDAAARFEAVVAGAPASPLAGPAQWSLTRSRLRAGNGNGALDALDDLLAHYAGWLGEQSPSLREGLDELAAGRLPEARAAFLRMVDEQPESELVPLAHALVARTWWNQGQPMQAIGAFADLFRSVRDEVAAYDELGGLLGRYAEGDTAVAEDFAARAEEVDEGFADIYRYLAARSLLEQNRFDETRDALEALRAAHPDGDFTHLVDLEHAWNLFRDGRAAEALPIFERLEREAASERTRSFDAFFDIGAELPMGIARCQLELGRYAEAAAAFERAIAEHPRSKYVLENRLGLALAYEKLGRLDEAERILARVVREHADAPQAWAVEQQLARLRARREGE